MIVVDNVNVYNIARAIYSARNPLNSWKISDSDLENNIVGEKDLTLAKKLYNAGASHRKYLRQIFVSLDITAPLYWWKEADQYKVGTVTNSCSTMHKIHAKEFELDDFSWEQLLNTGCDLFAQEFGKGIFARKIQPLQLLTDFIIPSLNVCREKYLETKHKEYWWQLIQLLPSSYNQKRTITINYENAVTMIKQRTGHKLDEWNDFVHVLRNLPYLKEIMGE